MTIEREKRTLREFLLGIEAERDGEEIGVRLIADPNFAADVEFAEESLIEEFLDGTLTEIECGLFLENFLTTPARTSLLEEIAALRAIARSHGASTVVVDERQTQSGFFSAIGGFFGLKLIAASILVLILAVGVWRFGFSEPELTDVEKSFAALNEKDLGDPSKSAGLTNQSLLYGTMRGDSVVKINGAGLTETVFFRLALPPGLSPDTRFDLELKRSGQVVFRQKQLKYYQNPNGGEVKVVIPRSVLQKGTYQLKLSSDVSYGFVVE